MPVTYTIEVMPYDNFAVSLYDCPGIWVGFLWELYWRNGTVASFLNMPGKDGETFLAVLTDELKERGLLPM